MPWYMTADARRDAEKQAQKRLTEQDVDKRCWKCGTGEFYLMEGSDYLWKCNSCGHIGHLKVYKKRRR